MKLYKTNLINRYNLNREDCIKVTIPLVYFIIFGLQHQIDVSSKHYRTVFNINPHNIANYLARLHSIRMFSVGVGSTISYIIYSLSIVSVNIQGTLSLGLLMIIRIIYFLAEHLSRRPSLHVFYVLNIEAFCVGLFQITVLSKFPEWASKATLYMDITGIIVSVIQIVADLFCYGNPSLIIKSQTYIVLVLTIVAFCFWVICVGKFQEIPNIDRSLDFVVNVVEIFEQNINPSEKREKYTEVLKMLLTKINELKERGEKVSKFIKDQGILNSEYRIKLLFDEYEVLKKLVESIMSHTEEDKIKEDIRLLNISQFSMNNKLREEILRVEEAERISKESKLKEDSKQTIVKVNIDPIKEEFFDRFMTLLSPFMMTIIATFFKEFLMPRLLPFALLEKEKCYIIMLIIPFIYISGSLTVYYIDRHITSLNQWMEEINFFGVPSIPMATIFGMTILAIHTKLAFMRILINSQMIVLIMITVLIFCYSIMRSASSVFVANYVVNKLKRNSLYIHILLGHTIITMFYQYAFCKMSMGYNRTRIALGYSYPNFKPTHTMKYGNSFIFWLGEVMYRGYKDALNDYNTDIKNYT